MGPGGFGTGGDTRPGVLLTPADAARVANVSRDTIYREIERGALPVRHVGRQLRIDPLDSAITSSAGPRHEARLDSRGTTIGVP
jgi:excisionase family DNA binding protein